LENLCSKRKIHRSRISEFGHDIYKYLFSYLLCDSAFIEVKKPLSAYLVTILQIIRGPGIATAYGLDGPGIEARWGEIFHTCPDRP
jgi:hypothetical protein